MLRTLHTVSLILAGAAVVAALVVVAIKNDAAVDHAGAPLWKSPGEAYRICSTCGERHADLEMPRCMRCKAPFFIEEADDEFLVGDSRKDENE